MFNCKKCNLSIKELQALGNTRPFLIRSLCVFCAPQLHSDHHFMTDTVTELGKLFESKTGKNYLVEWYSFEEYMVKELPEMDEGERFIHILQIKAEEEGA